MNKLILGDAREKVKDFLDETFQLIMTSPPYADRRKKDYGGIHPDEYVKWFEPLSQELLRIIKDDGTFIINIKENVVNGERSTYVIDLIKMMKNQGWLWTEEFPWIKKNAFPGKWKNRFRDSWERCLQFNKNLNFKMRQDSVMVKIGDWAKTRLVNLSETDKIRNESKVNSGFGKNISNWVGREMVYPNNVIVLEEQVIREFPDWFIEFLAVNLPEKVWIGETESNVIKLATECGNKGHSATYPVGLPEWFIKLFTDENDLVLDPFVGSGTTAVAAKKLSRQYVGIELNETYYEVAKGRVA